MSAAFTACAPRWIRHACPACAFIGTHDGVDVYECFDERTKGPNRIFTVRTGPLPHGGFAALTARGWILNAPSNVPPVRVLYALNLVVGRVA